MSLADVFPEALRAAGRIYDAGVRCTPLEYSYSLSEGGSCHVYCKLESEQVTGSFKARGAVNKVAHLLEHGAAHGIVTASTGNHALAMTYALQCVKGASCVPAHIYVPRSIAAVKLDTLTSRGAPIVIVDGDDCMHAEIAAMNAAREGGAIYVSPYNDLQVMAGQGTIGLEIHDQLTRTVMSEEGRPLVVVVPIGGGGMATGIAVALKRHRPQCIIIGVQPVENDCMYRSVALGRVAREGEYSDGETWSDGTAGGVEEGALTFEAFKHATTDAGVVKDMITRARGGEDVAMEGRFVDAMLTVTEAQIELGMMHMMKHHHKIVEGAAGSSVGFVMQHMDMLQGCTVICICCGSNIALSRVRGLLDKYVT